MVVSRRGQGREPPCRTPAAVGRRADGQQRVGLFAHHGTTGGYWWSLGDGLCGRPVAAGGCWWSLGAACRGGGTAAALLRPGRPRSPRARNPPRPPVAHLARPAPPVGSIPARGGRQSKWRRRRGAGSGTTRRGGRRRRRDCCCRKRGWRRPVGAHPRRWMPRGEGTAAATALPGRPSRPPARDRLCRPAPAHPAALISCVGSSLRQGGGEDDTAVMAQAGRQQQKDEGAREHRSVGRGSGAQGWWQLVGAARSETEPSWPPFHLVIPVARPSPASRPGTRPLVPRRPFRASSLSRCGSRRQWGRHCLCGAGCGTATKKQGAVGEQCPRVPRPRQGGGERAAWLLRVAQGRRGAAPLPPGHPPGRPPAHGDAPRPWPAHPALPARRVVAAIPAQERRRTGDGADDAGQAGGQQQTI